MNKVFIGIYYGTVVVVLAKKRADAAAMLRRRLGERHAREAAKLSLMNHVTFVYWSEHRRSYWYRLPGANPSAIHPARVRKDLRALVPKKEPDRPTWDSNTSASERGRGRA